MGDPNERHESLVARKATNFIAPVLVAAVVIAVSLFHWSRFEFTPYTSDQAYLAAMVLKYRQPDLFPGDPGLRFIDFYPKSYLGLVDLLFSATGDIKSALFVLGTALLVVFAAGMYLLLFDATQSAWVAAALAVASLWVRASFGGSNWEVAGPSAYIARTITLAMTPWLLLACRRSLGRWRLVGVFAALGIAANFHALSGVYTAVILGLALLFVPKMRSRHLVILVVSIPVFWVAAAPYVCEVRRAQYAFAAQPSALPQPTDEEVEQVMHERLPALFFPPWRTILWVGFHLMLPALCGVAGLWLHWRRRTPADWIVVGFAVGAVLVSFGVMFLLAYLRSAFSLQKSVTILRAFKLIYLPLWVSCGWLLVDLWNWETTRARLATVFLAAALLVPASGPEYAVRWVKYRGKVPVRQSVETDLDFQATCDWIRIQTFRSARFLVDPNWHLFRVLARRPMVATRKEISLVIVDAAVGVDAYRRWHEVWKAYDRRSPDALIEVAKRYKADYILVVDIEMPGKPIFRRGRYAVYAVAKDENSSSVRGE